MKVCTARYRKLEQLYECYEHRLKLCINHDIIDLTRHCQRFLP